VNKDQAKGHAKGLAGRLQQKLGKLFGSKKHQVKGAAKRVAGAAHKAGGDARAIASRRARKQAP
jgi:uncharacterized protein YjbJ (UPF0337 family)